MAGYERGQNEYGQFMRLEHGSAQERAAEGIFTLLSKLTVGSTELNFDHFRFDCSHSGLDEIVREADGERPLDFTIYQGLWNIETSMGRVFVEKARDKNEPGEAWVHIELMPNVSTTNSVTVPEQIVLKLSGTERQRQYHIYETQKPYGPDQESLERLKKFHSLLDTVLESNQKMLRDERKILALTYAAGASAVLLATSALFGLAWNAYKDSAREHMAQNDGQAAWYFGQEIQLSNDSLFAAHPDGLLAMPAEAATEQKSPSIEDYWVRKPWPFWQEERADRTDDLHSVPADTVRVIEITPEQKTNEQGDHCATVWFERLPGYSLLASTDAVSLGATSFSPNYDTGEATVCVKNPYFDYKPNDPGAPDGDGDGKKVTFAVYNRPNS
jgi:hypothetical protein